GGVAGRGLPVRQRRRRDPGGPLPAGGHRAGARTAGPRARRRLSHYPGELSPRRRVGHHGDPIGDRNRTPDGRATGRAMNEVLQTGQVVRTVPAGLACRVEAFLGGGNQGEVYRARLEGGDGPAGAGGGGEPAGT